MGIFLLIHMGNPLDSLALIITVRVALGCLVFIPDDPPLQGWVVVVGCPCGLTLPMPLMRWGWHRCVGGVNVAVGWHGHQFGGLHMLLMRCALVGGLSPELLRI